MKSLLCAFLLCCVLCAADADAEVIELSCRTSGDWPVRLRLDLENNALQLGDADYDIVDKSRYFVTAYQRMQPDQIGGATIVVNLALYEYIRGYAGLPDHHRTQIDNMTPRDLPALEAGGFSGRCYTPY